jgi:hypothetical protein
MLYTLNKACLRLGETDNLYPALAVDLSASVNLASRYRIVGVEVVGLGLFVILLLLLEAREAGTDQTVQGFSWVWGIVGITLVLVGLELLSLNRRLPVESPTA